MLSTMPKGRQIACSKRRWILAGTLIAGLVGSVVFVLVWTLIRDDDDDGTRDWDTIEEELFCWYVDKQHDGSVCF